MTASGRSPAATAFQVGLVLIGLVVLVGVGWIIRGLVIQMFIAVVLAAGLLSAIVALERRMPRAPAVAITLLAFVAAVIALLILVVPPLVAQIILEQLEGLVVTPLIQSHAVEISPLAVMFGVLAGFTLAGIVGGLLAIPVVAMLDVVLSGIVFPLQASRGIVQPVAAGAASAPAPTTSGDGAG